MTPRVGPHTFIALDGESRKDKRGIDYLCVFQAASSRGHIESIEKWRRPGLGTLDCLNFLISLNATARRKFIGFGFGWDTNMILADINEPAYKALRKNHTCHVGTGDGMCYRIEHLPRKILTISKGWEHWHIDPKLGKRYDTFEVAKHPDGRKMWMQIYDVWGFFQTGFVKAMLDWKIIDQAEADYFQEFKDARGAFEKLKRADVKGYNLAECVRLAQCLEVLDEKVTKGLGIGLHSYHGAGAIGQKLLEKYHAKDYLPKSEHDSLLHSYFGGRIQCLRLGRFDKVYSYDIRSAYPYIISQMPRFYLQPIRRVSEIGPWSVVRVSWNIPPEARLGPFPFRLRDGSIQFYLNGEGYYHASEVLAAMRMFPKHIEVLEIWEIPYNDNMRPFAWLEEMYKYRSMIRATGDLAHIAIKLGLNSVYGKTAQKVGHRGHEPAYRSYMVAGATTAGTRAMLLDAAKENPESIIMFATDGIASTEQLNLALGTDLGYWEEEAYDSLSVYQPGLYVYDKAGILKQKTRSILPPAEEERANWWNEIHAVWERFGTASLLEFKERHFMTYGVSHNREDWRKWKERPKLISLAPTKGYPLVDGPGPTYHLQPIHGPGSMSRAYDARREDPEAGYTQAERGGTGGPEVLRENSTAFGVLPEIAYTV